MSHFGPLSAFRKLFQSQVPVILATQEAEIRRIMVQNLLWQRVWETLSQKYPTQNRAGGVAQVARVLA
jgi:hypothetical protein